MWPRYGVIGTGMVVGSSKVMLQWFHRGYSHFSSNQIYAYSSQLGDDRPVYMNQCSTFLGDLQFGLLWSGPQQVHRL